MNERFTGKNLLELPQDFSVVQIETTDLMKNARKSPYFNAGMDRAKLT